MTTSQKTNMKLGKFTSPMFSLIFLIYWGCVSNSFDIKFPDGGYNFEVPGPDSSFTQYPIRNKIPRADSFRIAYYGNFHLKALDETNISLRPGSKPIFKLLYESREQLFTITLDESQLTVKEWKSGMVYPIINDSLLDTDEQAQLSLLKRRFPFDKPNHSPKFARFEDSMRKLYPQLASSEYYLQLLIKASEPKADSVKYTVKNVNLTREQYQMLLYSINNSGYWKMPFETYCSDISTDSPGYFLEANTGKKYNFVHSPVCYGDSSPFAKSCQAIIDLAAPDRKPTLY